MEKRLEVENEIEANKLIQQIEDIYKIHQKVLNLEMKISSILSNLRDDVKEVYNETNLQVSKLRKQINLLGCQDLIKDKEWY